MATLSLDTTAMVSAQCINGIEIRERLENFSFAFWMFMPCAFLICNVDMKLHFSSVLTS